METFRHRGCVSPHIDFPQRNSANFYLAIVRHFYIYSGVPFELLAEYGGLLILQYRVHALLSDLPS
jgi:hypothetical protein